MKKKPDGILRQVFSYEYKGYLLNPLAVMNSQMRSSQV